MLRGFIVAIPVFFDVALIILIPMLYALQKETRKSLLLYAIPLLAGLAINHAFIPPTPGPIAVADILGADLGWVIAVGLIVGIPCAVLAGPVFAKYCARRIFVAVPQSYHEIETPIVDLPKTWVTLSIIFLPIFLILLHSMISLPLAKGWGIPDKVSYLVLLIGHPFSALILANLIAWYVLGMQRGLGKDKLLAISTKALYPAGMIILLTGAGGAFKQVLIDTGSGTRIATTLSIDYFLPILFAFVVAAIVHLLQGSSMVAMITAAGLTAPILAQVDFGIFRRPFWS